MTWLKLDGRPLAYSPPTRFAELDFLAMGIDGKRLLCRTYEIWLVSGAGCPT